MRGGGTCERSGGKWRGDGKTKNKNRAAHIHGHNVVRGLALHPWIFARGFLEGRTGDSVMAVLLGDKFQPATMTGSVID